MFLFYIDESGNPDMHHQPIVDGETPLFVLTGICIHETNWKNITHDFNHLKQRFFRNEIGDEYPLYYEIKGNDLTRPRNRTNRRNHAYLRSIMDLCDRYSIPFFSMINKKSLTSPIDKTSVYTMSLQYLCERFQAYLDENTDNGLLVIDSRVHNIDLQVAKSHLSYVFGNVHGKQCTRIIESPMFSDSKISAGLQIVDLVSSCIYTTNYCSKCKNIPGALDYSHMIPYRQRLAEREFHSRQKHNGYIKHGFRTINHKR